MREFMDSEQKVQPAVVVEVVVKEKIVKETVILDGTLKDEIERLRAIVSDYSPE